MIKIILKHGDLILAFFFSVRELWLLFFALILINIFLDD